MQGKLGRLAVLLIACLMTSGLMARPSVGQLAGVTPRFVYAPALPAAIGPITHGQPATWLGGDNGSMAVFPDGKTTFWTFGDTFIGPPGAVDRSFRSPKVVNTIAIGRVETNPATGVPQFNPYYYYRGSFTYQGRQTTNNPSPFFPDPDAYSDDPNIAPKLAPDPNSAFPPNRNVANPTGAVTQNPLTDTQVSRFWTGKAFFYQNKLFVFANRFSSNGLPLGTSIARIPNAVDSTGGATNPVTWRIEYLKLSTVSQRDRLFAPVVGVESFVANAEDLLVYGVLAIKPGGRTFIMRVPIEPLLNAPPGTDLSSLIQYRADGPDGGHWANSSTPGQPVGRADAMLDPGIPGGGGFTVRLVVKTGLYRNVFIDYANDSGHVSVQTSRSPFGPFTDRQHVFRLPELDPTNTPLDINKFANGYNVGIYNPWLATKSTVKCYMAYETPVFAADPDNQVAFTYSVDDAGNKAPYPEGCQCAPGQPAHTVWENNFYRVKAVPAQTPYPANVP